jgi:hypothetical protein
MGDQLVGFPGTGSARMKTAPQGLSSATTRQPRGSNSGERNLTWRQNLKAVSEVKIVATTEGVDEAASKEAGRHRMVSLQSSDKLRV